MSFLIVLLEKIDGPGLPGGLLIYQGHLFPLKGHLCRKVIRLVVLWQEEASAELVLRFAGEIGAREVHLNRSDRRPNNACRKEEVFF